MSLTIFVLYDIFPHSIILLLYLFCNILSYPDYGNSNHAVCYYLVYSETECMKALGIHSATENGFFIKNLPPDLSENLY